MFKPGDRVICINADSSTFHAAHLLREGQIYVVRESNNSDRPSVWLEGIMNGFYASRFRPVNETPFQRSIREYIQAELR